MTPKLTQTLGKRLMRGSRGLLVCVAIAASLVGSGCGPIQAMSAVGDAEEALEAAEIAEAHRYARYEYWMAIFYLDKAKRVDGRAEYSAAEAFAEASAKFAAVAVDAAGKEKLRQLVMQQRMRARTGKDR